MQTLGEDLVLLSINPRSGRLANATRLRFGLLGSELVRLAASRRVDITGGRIVVLDSGPTGDRELDAARSCTVPAR
jgi:Golgi phosphoprotein 3 (GPP34)